MLPESQQVIKVIAGTAVVIALGIGFFERWYKPDYLLLESSRELPAWIGWFGWVLAASGALAYFFVDLQSWL